MATQMTEKKSARFDVRRYDERLPKEQRQILADTENVTVTITYQLAELPSQYRTPQNTPDEFVRVYQSKEAKAANAPADRAAIKFKVGANCKWFDKYGHETQRPTNADLEKMEVEVQICYTRKERNASKPTAPCGYWANGIMYRETGNGMFAGVEFEKDETDTPEDMDAAAAPAPQPAPAGAQDDADDELPF